MTHRIRKAPKVMLAATIWFSVSVEMKMPSEMSAPPSSTATQIAGKHRSERHFRRAVCEHEAIVEHRGQQHDDKERQGCQKLTENDLYDS
jgi:hypothetical protein